MWHKVSVIEKVKQGFLLDKLTFYNTQVCIEKNATLGKLAQCQMNGGFFALIVFSYKTMMFSFPIHVINQILTILA